MINSESDDSCGGIGGAWWPEPDENDPCADDFMNAQELEPDFEDTLSAEELMEYRKKEKIFNEVQFVDINFQEDNLEELFNLMSENLPITDFCGYWAVNYPKEKLFTEFVHNISGKAIIVKYEGKIIGYSQLNFTEDGEYVFLYNLVIHKNYRRSGLATKLFNYMLDYVTTGIFHVNKIIIGSDCVKSKPIAYQFFTKMGFVDEPGREDLLTYDCSNLDFSDIPF